MYQILIGDYPVNRVAPVEPVFVVVPIYSISQLLNQSVKIRSSRLTLSML